METCKTLGADKPKKNLHDRYFKFSYCHNELILIWGFTKNKPKFAIIKDDLIKTVILRVKDMLVNDKVNSRKVGYYSSTHWVNCPDTVLCPYIAKLVLDVFPTETIERILYENQG